MPLSKGFLIHKIAFPKKQLIIGLLFWVGSAVILYGFFYFFREIFRLYTGYLGSLKLLILNSEQTFLYNLFFSALSSALGFSVGLGYLIRNSVPDQEKKRRFLFRRLLTEVNFSSWNFLAIISRFGSVLGIIYGVFYFEYEFDWLVEYRLLLILLPLVLFFSPWPKLSRLIKAQKLKWFLGLTSFYLLLSITLSYVDFIDYKKINGEFVKESLVNDFQKPYSVSQKRLNHQSLVFELYLVNNPKGDKPLLFWEHIKYSPVEYKYIQAFVHQELNSVSLYEKNLLTANLHIDGRIQMSKVSHILNELSKAGLSKIQFATGKKDSPYPSSYPGFDYYGIQAFLIPLDSAKGSEIEDDTITFQNHLIVSDRLELKTQNRIEINLEGDDLYLNEQRIDHGDLAKDLNSLLNQYAPDYVVIFRFSPNITYGHFIEIQDCVHTQVDALRDKLSYRIYNIPMDKLRVNHDLETIRNKYPSRLIAFPNKK
jgi:biopolymer transport protein ExbD